jgi:signal transduction histidine kinase
VYAIARFAAFVCLGVVVSGCGSRKNASDPIIQFTEVPRASEGGPNSVELIEGRVIGSRPGQQIVLFAHWGPWWVQPLKDNPFTTIQDDSTWKNSIHLGLEYAALVVERGYQPPAVTDVLPGRGNGVVALATVKGRPPLWQTWWFVVINGSALVLAALAFIQFRIREMSRQMNVRLEERLAERTRIAGELHDGVLQQITSLSLVLGAAKQQVPPDSEVRLKITDVQRKLMQVGADIRQLSHELHPAVLQNGGLPAALSSYCEEFSKARGIPVCCETDPTVRDLSEGSALSLYRIAQEALGNVAKHAKAKHVRVRLTRSKGLVRLSVSDDGVGCVSDQAVDSGGLGLVNMRERVRQLNGSFNIQGELGRGSTVTAEVPFRPTS